MCGGKKGKRGGEVTKEQGGAILECAGRVAAARVHLKGLGHRGEHPAKSSSPFLHRTASRGHVDTFGSSFFLN